MAQTMTATQMAELYGMKSSIAFNKVLTECKVLRHTDKGFVLDDSLQGKGYTTAVSRPCFLPNGFCVEKKKSVWTEKGQAYIRLRLGRIGIVPVSEQKDMFSTN